MIVRKHLKWSIILKSAWPLLAGWTILATACYLLYYRYHLTSLALPFAPIAVLGTALSIFLGFRNSSSYDRWWEGRKIWGGIVNQSRNLARQIITLHSGQGAADQQRLIYRHLAWVNLLRLQLRGQTTEKHLSPLRAYLSEQEWDELEGARNRTTQLLLTQARDLAQANRNGAIDDFRHMQLDNTLTELCNLQGQCERIKNTPLPRQYNFFNLMFMHIFIVLLPFGLLKSFEEAEVHALLVPLCVLTGFVFYVVEGVGRRIEDPFENKITDVPLSALCRTIEIDLRQMLAEKEIPVKLEPVDGFLF